MSDKKVNHVLIKNAIDQYNDYWKWGNEVLYTMCEKNSFKKGEIIGKIWIIGRSYAAALERTRKLSQEKRDEIYYNFGKNEQLINIHKKISELKQYKTIDESNKNIICKMHSDLTNIFQKISNLHKRSLASKYLHFHLPDLFYIYDDRAKTTVNCLFRIYKGKLPKQKQNDADKQYVNFVDKMMFISKKFKEEFGEKYSPRELDTILLYYYDEYLKDKK